MTNGGMMGRPVADVQRLPPPGQALPFTHKSSWTTNPNGEHSTIHQKIVNHPPGIPGLRHEDTEKTRQQPKRECGVNFSARPACNAMRSIAGRVHAEKINATVSWRNTGRGRSLRRRHSLSGIQPLITFNFHETAFFSSFSFYGSMKP